MDEKKFYSLLGLCMRARRLVSGEFAVEKGVKRGDVCLVVLAGDASENTKKKFTNMCDFYNTEILIVGNISLLGRALGKEKRAVIGITDEGFRKSIEKLINEKTL